MLIQLDIENVAVIEHASIEFEKGLNVITGETGAGKSLLINSLNMVLGSRASRELIREGAQFARVCAVFFNKDFDSELINQGIEADEGNIAITRKLFADGRNICHINGTAVSVSQLNKIGKKLVVIHGQRDSGELLDTSAHINFLDSYIGAQEKLSEYGNIYKEYKAAKAELKNMNLSDEARRNEIDYLSYQIAEIEKAGLSAEEEEELIARKNLLENAETIKNCSEAALSAISGDGGAKELLYEAKRQIERLLDFDSDCRSMAEKASELYYELEELGRDISSYGNSTEFNPYELENITERLNLINTLKRKYNRDVNGILEFFAESSKRLSELISYDEKNDELEKRSAKLEAEAKEYAQVISNVRKSGARALCEKLCGELESLDMPKCKIEFSFSDCDLYEKGIDDCELLLSTNPTEAPKSLNKIASGGEMSRIMLAIKSVFCDFDGVPTLLFDEIDTGVSGRAAEKIARKMKKLSENIQIICVTHLPMIAASGENHLLIEKKMTEEGFKTVVAKLDTTQRENEIARIVSGDNINEISLENSRQLLSLYLGKTEE